MYPHTIQTMHRLAIVAVACVGLAACGSSNTDRALSGGAIGAGVGAVGSSIFGGSATKGAVLGGAAGAATGVLTKEKDVNLGKPVWR